ncbi:hypothetical protein [Alkaliphilus metalliredigens]|nr:hypothetical protein [Alkaliphilus metalliredigens]
MITVIMIISVVLLLALSMVTVSTNHYQMVHSSSSGIKAYYLAESAIDITTYELLIMSEQAIFYFLTDLQSYKIQYILEGEEGDTILLKDYHPPILENYLEDKVVDHLSIIERRITQPFEEYHASHYYEILIEGVSLSTNHIQMMGIGSYDEARRFIKFVVQLPEVIEVGVDALGLPEIEVVPLRVVSYYQTFGE